MRLFMQCAARYGVMAMCLSAAACGGDSTTAPVPPPDIGGSWQLTVTVSNSALAMTCQAAGPATITQDGVTFGGEVKGSEGSCIAPADTTDTNVDGQISDGHISGQTVTYANSGCHYSGAISGAPANTISGDVSCTVVQDNQNYPFNGTWEVRR